MCAPSAGWSDAKRPANCEKQLSRIAGLAQKCPKTAFGVRMTFPIGTPVAQSVSARLTLSKDELRKAVTADVCWKSLVDQNPDPEYPVRGIEFHSTLRLTERRSGAT